MNLEPVTFRHYLENLESSVVVCASQCLQELLVWWRDSIIKLVSRCPEGICNVQSANLSNGENLAAAASGHLPPPVRGTSVRRSIV